MNLFIDFLSRLLFLFLMKNFLVLNALASPRYNDESIEKQVIIADDLAHSQCYISYEGLLKCSINDWKGQKAGFKLKEWRINGKYISKKRKFDRKLIPGKYKIEMFIEGPLGEIKKAVSVLQLNFSFENDIIQGDVDKFEPGDMIKFKFEKHKIKGRYEKNESGKKVFKPELISLHVHYSKSAGDVGNYLKIYNPTENSFEIRADDIAGSDGYQFLRVLRDDGYYILSESFLVVYNEHGIGPGFGNGYELQWFDCMIVKNKISCLIPDERQDQRYTPKKWIIRGGKFGKSGVIASTKVSFEKESIPPGRYVVELEFDDKGGQTWISSRHFKIKPIK